MTQDVLRPDPLRVRAAGGVQVNPVCGCHGVTRRVSAGRFCSSLLRGAPAAATAYEAETPFETAIPAQETLLAIEGFGRASRWAVSGDRRSPTLRRDFALDGIRGPPAQPRMTCPARPRR